MDTLDCCWGMKSVCVNWALKFLYAVDTMFDHDIALGAILVLRDAFFLEIRHALSTPS